MSYSHKNPAWNNLQRSRHDARIQAEAARANELQRHNPGMRRDYALKQAIRETESRLP